MLRLCAAVFVVAALLVGMSAGGASSKRSAGNSSEIYSANTDGSDRVNLSQNAADDSFPVESPRGGRIAFVSDRDGYDAIYVTNDDGSEQHRLTDRVAQGPDTSCRLRELVWSPSGATIAFTAECVSLHGDPRDIRTSVDVVSSSGGSVRELVPGGSDPSFSADGRFVADQSKANLIAPTFVGFVAVDGGHGVTLGLGDSPAWSPKGHRLAFDWGRRGVAVIDAARPAHRWTFRNPTVGGPAWSPRGDVLAFFLGGPRPGIYVVRPGARRASRLVDLGEGAGVYWAPNGRWLALRGGDSTYVVARDGRFLRRIGGPASEPAWSPDSSHVAWADESLGGVAVTSPRSQATFLAIPSTAVYGLTWTRDSRRLIFASASIG